MKTLIAVVALATLLLPLILTQANAQMITHERSVTLKVTNTKTNTVTTKVWKLTGYTFGERPLDINDVTVSKIKRALHTDSFSFTLHNKVFEGKWLHFNVELIGTPLIGQGLKIKFL